MSQRTLVVLLVALFALANLPARVFAQDATTVRQLKKEMDRIKAEREQERKQLQDLEKKIDELESSNQKLQQTTNSLQQANQQLTTQTTQSISQMQKQLSPEGFGSLVGNYLGEHQVTLVGAAGGDFIYDHLNNTNTFNLDFEPIALYKVNDWLMFEGTVEASLDPGSGASFDLPVATAQIFLNKYMEINAGIFDQPFGDWYEDQSPMWVNPFISAPLIYGANPLIPPTDIGVQLRGAVQWGDLGQDADYTVWLSNGPTFESSPGINALPAPVVGEAIAGPDNIAVNSNTRGMGGRFRVYPLPVDLGWGRLELEASTFDGKWDNSLWFYSWGVGFAYRDGPFRTRGEWVEMYREMPSASSLGLAAYPGCCGSDNRQGWYWQAGYFLYGIPHPDLGAFEQYFDKTEFLVRYSGINESGSVLEDIATTPSFGFNGSPAVFAPHAREVALGLDYWIAPSIVWQTEVDFELPEAGGTLYTFGGLNKPLASAVGATSNDQAVLTQFTIGF